MTPAPQPTSWVAATWVTPAVPALWVLLLLGLTLVSDVQDQQRTFHAVGLGVALVLAGLAAGLTRATHGGVRGAAYGVLAGGLACALPSVWVLLR